MVKKPTYEELENRIRELERAESEAQMIENALRETEKPPYKELEQKISDLGEQIAELKYRENHLCEIFENAPLGILHFDNLGTITACNDHFVNIIGSSKEMLIGLNMLTLPDKRIVHALEETLSGQTSQFEGEYSSITANKITPVRLKFNPVFSNKGIIEGGIGIIEDVTERKLSEKGLIESERRFRELAEMLPETIFEIDLQGRLTFVNQKAFDLFGYTHEDFEKGINVLELVHEKDRERVIINIGKILKGENLGVTEYEISRKDGSFFPGLFHSSVISHNNKPLGFRGFLIDITEKKRTQEILVQNEKMMSIGGLAAGMAHEINNPLAGMMQNSQVIFNRLTKEMPANNQIAEELGTSMTVIQKFMEKRGVLKQLESINSAGTRAAKIIENMLSFVRKGDSIKNENKIDQIIDQTIELAGNDYDLKKKYDFKKIEIIREYCPDLPPILCEGSKIQQVLFNILKNAAEAMSQNKSSNSPKIIIRALKQSKMAILEIEDNGPGIDAETRRRILEPFFTTKSVGMGTGLGLSVSYFIIVEDHKGKMEVESILGQGTKFIIKLPL